MGSTFLESEEGVVFIERQTIDYTCPASHIFDVTFAVDAKVPGVQGCPQCSQKTLRVGTEDFAEEKTIKPRKTHWGRLRDRRSVEELDVLLGERLEAYRLGHRH